MFCTFRRTVALRRQAVWRYIQYVDKISRQSGKTRIATLVAVRRWASAEGSPLHEQARADRVGESLEPGGVGAVWPIKSEVARATDRLRGSMSVERAVLLEDGKSYACSKSHQGSIKGIQYANQA